MSEAPMDSEPRLSLWCQANPDWAATAIERLEAAIQEIARIVHVPTKNTAHRTADRHYQADFDAIRKITSVVTRPQSGGAAE